MIARPSSVGTTGMRLRSKSTTPSSSSSFFTMLLSVGCVTKQASAARAKCRCASMATMYWSCWTVMRAKLLIHAIYFIID